jgi:hypothetical protein
MDVVATAPFIGPERQGGHKAEEGDRRLEVGGACLQTEARRGRFERGREAGRLGGEM